MLIFRARVNCVQFASLVSSTGQCVQHCVDTMNVFILIFRVMKNLFLFVGLITLFTIGFASIGADVEDNEFAEFEVFSLALCFHYFNVLD